MPIPLDNPQGLRKPEDDPRWSRVADAVRCSCVSEIWRPSDWRMNTWSVNELPATYPLMSSIFGLALLP